MSVEFAYRFPQNPPPSDLRELDLVALTVAVVTDDGDTIPAGTQGTIVRVQNAGPTYVIEFAEPAGALATVEPNEVSLIERFDS